MALPAELRTEIAGVARDALMRAFGEVLEPRDEILRLHSGGRGLALYEDMKRDPRLRSVLDKRKRAVTSRPWDVSPGLQEGEVEPTPQAEAAADLAERALKRLRFDELTKGMLDAPLKGLTVTELVWEVVPGPSGDALLPTRALPRQPERFMFTTSGELRLRVMGKPEGETLPARKFVVHRFGAESDDPYGSGLGATLFWPVLFKRVGSRFWADVLERFGQPFAVGKYPPQDTKTRDVLLDIIAAIGQRTGMALPEGTAVEFPNVMSAANTDGHERFLRYWDERISEVVLGETLSTAVGDSGSRALGEVHDNVRLETARDDGDAVSETLNATLLRWIADLNIAGAGSAVAYPEVWRDFDESEDQDKAAERDVKLKALGWQPTEERIREVYGEGYERVAAQGTGDGPSTRPGGAAQDEGQGSEPAGAGDETVAAGFAEGDELAPDPTTRVDELADQLAAGEQLGELVAAVSAAIAGAGSYAEAEAALLKVAAEHDMTAFAEAMAEATATAHLAGRSDVADVAKDGTSPGGPPDASR